MQASQTRDRDSFAHILRATVYIISTQLLITNLASIPMASVLWLMLHRVSDCHLLHTPPDILSLPPDYKVKGRSLCFPQGS